MQIYELMPKVMADVGAIEKNRKNEQQKYKFRGIDDVFAAFQPVLAKHQIFYVPEVLNKEVTERESASNRTLIYTTLTVAYTFYAPDGSNVRSVVVGEAMDSGDKSSNKAMSAALKYALLQIFCVPTESNEDADEQSHDLRFRHGDRRRAEHRPPSTETRREPEPEAAESPVERPTPRNGAVVENKQPPPGPTLFWSIQRTGDVSQEQARKIVAQCGENWNEACTEILKIAKRPEK